jgi:methyl-accepting chemotaxis protein
VSAAAGTGSELRRIVRINEEIKSVVATAFKINLMAMNAIFLAKRAGQAALGFSVLSNELRRFASDLQRQMGVLRDMTHDSVASVTALVKHERVNRMIDRLSTEAGGKAREMVAQHRRRRLLSTLSDREDALRAQNRRLGQTIADTSQLVELGSVLARSAKIEAAYGGGFAPALMQVSSDFERTIAEIQRSLELLSRNQGQEART